MLDEVFDGDGNRVSYRQWPDTADGDIDDNGTVRPMTEAEVAEWHARNPPAPLVAPEDFIPEDEVQASIAALTEDIITLRETLKFWASNGRPPTTQEAAALAAAAIARLAQLADDPAVRRGMLGQRVGRAEAARGE